jgi:hypothetical protein
VKVKLNLPVRILLWSVASCFIGWLFTPFHELGHIIGGKLCGMEITSYNLMSYVEFGEHAVLGQIVIFDLCAVLFHNVVVIALGLFTRKQWWGKIFLGILIVNLISALYPIHQDYLIAGEYEFFVVVMTILFYLAGVLILIGCRKWTSLLAIHGPKTTTDAGMAA